MIKKYIFQLLQDIGHIYANPKRIPIDPNVSLNDNDGELFQYIYGYHKLIGRLM